MRSLSTSFFVMGQEKAADYWRENQNFDMILLTEKGEIYLTEGLADKFELEPEYGDVEVELDEKLRTQAVVEKSEDNQLQAAIEALR